MVYIDIYQIYIYIFLIIYFSVRILIADVWSIRWPALNAMQRCRWKDGSMGQPGSYVEGKVEAWYLLVRCIYAT